MFKCGFYEKEITPPLGSFIPGYNCTRLTETVHDKLYAKAIAVATDEKTVIIISIDSCHTTKAMHDGIMPRIEQYTGVKAENVMITATHTHLGLPEPYEYPPEYAVEDEHYVDVLLRMIADTAILAWQRMEPATMRYSKSVQEGLGFNRNYYMKDGNIRTNPGRNNPDIVKNFGPTDPEFGTLFFYDNEGKAMGSIMNFACHHDCVGGRWGMTNSSDYSGIIAESMKKEHGSNFVSVFILGACGNINHVNPFRTEAYKRPRAVDIGEALSKAALEHFKNAQPIECDKLDCIKEEVYINKRYFDKEEIDEAYYLYETMPWTPHFDINKPETKEYKRAKAKTLIDISKIEDPIKCIVQTIRLGECMIFALPSEIYTEFGLEIKAKSPADINMVSSLSNGGPICYIPIPEAYGTTIYEAQPTSAFLEKNAGWKLVEHALGQAEKLK